jgi:eukaryotic-like serine/threonine-protein kinase
MPSPFPPGTKLGRYEIRSQLGAGGMGEVYLAVDPDLNRRVALKILPEEFAGKPQAMQRFIQEAKAASGLNHPNIITIYEVGTDAGTYFIATEYVDGDTLRTHISRGQLSIGKAVDVGLQIASALSTAHSAGIIHRDIKPENIMLRRDGIVKVLDFGLAKLTERWTTADVDPDAATKAIVQTQSGVIVGTTAYMSPEQTRALEVDPRTDIWSLGVTLYEMVVGTTPFKGLTASDTSAAILRSDPTPLSEMLPETPFELERIVSKALQKERDERYQVIKDLELDLKALKRQLDLGTTLEPYGSVQSRATWSLQSARSTRSTMAEPRAVSTVETVSKLPRWMWPVVIILLLAFGLGGWYVWQQLRNRRLEPSNLIVTQLTSRKNDLGETGTRHARFSPDGKFIVYASAKDGVSPIWLKQVSGGEPFTNRSAEGIAATPIWSPDGQQIAFLSRREGQTGIWTMAAFGGAPTLVKNLERSSRQLVFWSKGGHIYFISQGNLYALNTSTQQINQVTSFDSTKPVDRGFSVSPDEQQIVYTETQEGQSDLWVVPRSGGQALRATNDKPEDSQPVWTADGKKILYSSKRNGIKQIFMSYLDGRQPAQLTTNDNNTDVLDISSDGTKILYATGREELDLWTVTLDQLKESQLTSDSGIELWPDVSPDNQSVVFQGLPANTGATLFNSVPQVKPVATDTPSTQLAPDGFAARWSPDGKQIAFLRQASGGPNLWTVHSSGGDARALTTGGIAFGGYTYLPYNRSQSHDFEWSVDGSKLVYCARDGGAANVWEISADGSAKKQLSDNTNDRLLFFNPTVSTDGVVTAWVALSPPQSGRKETTWSIWLARDGKAEQAFESESVLGIVGWSESQHELIFKSIRGASNAPSVPVDLSLFVLDSQTRQQRLLSELKAAYFQNVQLAPARNLIAFVTRENGPDSLRVISTKGGLARTILSSSDPRVYFSALNWAPGGKTIVYAKQSSWTTLSMLDNFRQN